MTYKRFEDVPVWKDALRLAKLVFELSTSGAFRQYSGFKDQVERAVVSVSNNIAEGFERGTNGELLMFLYIAKGSVAEVRSMLCLLDHVREDDASVGDTASAKRLSESISRQLCGWIESLKDSGFEGNRSQNEQTRNGREGTRRRDDFLAHLADVQARAKDRKDFPPDRESSS